MVCLPLRGLKWHRKVIIAYPQYTPINSHVDAYMSATNPILQIAGTYVVKLGRTKPIDGGALENLMVCRYVT